MAVRFFPTIKRFFEGTSGVVGTPSGDARGHVRVYTNEIVRRGRNF